jgi:hypothetical protein
MMALSREELLMKLGAARAHAPAAWRLVGIAVAPEGVTFTYSRKRSGRAEQKLRRRRNGISTENGRAKRLPRRVRDV